MIVEQEVSKSIFMAAVRKEIFRLRKKRLNRKAVS